MLSSKQLRPREASSLSTQTTRAWIVRKTKAHRATPPMQDPSHREWQGSNVADSLAGHPLQTHTGAVQYLAALPRTLPL
eukprot:6492713-Amphidinium_carterae.1